MTPLRGRSKARARRDETVIGAWPSISSAAAGTTEVVLPVDEAYRIRTGESGEETLQAHPGAAEAERVA